MSRNTHSSRSPFRNTILGLLGAIALSALPAAAQPQPGRILVDNTGPSILEFNVDGTNGFAIAGNTDNNVVFSPSVAGNGTIAFTANTDVDGTYLGHPYIFLMNADGTNVRNITSTLPGSSSNCCYNLNPAISPDGTAVAFLASVNAAPNGSQQQEIYLVNADGSNLRQLTPFMANPGGDYSQSYMDGLAWSPDSSTLAFRGTVYTSQCGTYFGQPIFVSVVGSIKTDGTNMQFLACDNVDGYVTSIDWSPDGTLLAWGRNVSHGAQGCSGCVGEPAIAFYDFSGQNRYSNGIASGALGTDSCQGGPHCIHFSPDSSQLAYVDAYPNNGNPCQSSCNVSFINLDGSGLTNSPIPSGGHTVWWMPGAAIPAPAQLTVAGPNGPASTIEVWPGFTQQVIPSLSDSTGNLILHSAQNFLTTHYFYASNCLAIGPFGLALYTGASGNGYGTISATNAGLTSNAINFNCWQSSPCTFTLGSTYTNIPAGGGTGMVGITADPGSSGSTCPWNAIPSASWIIITSGANGSGNGSVNFSVAANSGAARQGTITIAGQTYTVNQDAAGSGVTLKSITVAPNPASVPVGLTQQFTATGNYSDGSTQTLTTSVIWSSSNTSSATISNSGGTQGLATGVAAGAPVTITAALSGINGTAQLTVTAPVLQSIAVTPANPSVPTGSTQQFTATGTYSDGSQQNITGSATWTSSNTTVATIGASSGLASALAAGTTMIKAAIGAISGSTTMTVITLQSITITPVNSSIVAGTTQQFIATGHYNDGSARDLTSKAAWTSMKTNVATITSPGGLATGIAKGSTTIRGALGAISGSTSLTVSPVALQSITVTPASATVFVQAGLNGTQQFTATGHYNNGTTQDLTSSASWSASPKMVASVNSTGLATGLKPGTATISAKSGGSTGSATLTVQ